MGQDETLKTEFYLNIILKQYRPEIIIQYIRKAYKDKISDARITIDREIKTTKDCKRFFDDFDASYSENYILEIKYGEKMSDTVKMIMKKVKKRYKN